MEEEDYIELDSLLSKLRVICLKELGTLNKSMLTSGEEYLPVHTNIRETYEKYLKTIRNIDAIRKMIPLQTEDGLINVN